MERFFCHLIIALIVHVSHIANRAHCQTFCNREASVEWHAHQQTVQLKWTLIDSICANVSQCWDSQEGEESSGRPLSFPQLCPLQLQHGDKLLMSADETLQSYGITLINVSKENFESCSTDGPLKDQFLFPHNINESESVEPKWLVPGHHYFIALHDGDTQLCKLGLRLNVSVKTQLCQSSPLLRLCSGNGICQTGLWEDAYRCHCRRHYSGRFCEKFDACLDNPCENKGVCLSNGSTDPSHRTYKCLCPPHFTGKDKTETNSFQMLRTLNDCYSLNYSCITGHIYKHCCTPLILWPLLHPVITINQILFKCIELCLPKRTALLGEMFICMYNIHSLCFNLFSSTALIII